MLSDNTVDLLQRHCSMPILAVFPYGSRVYGTKTDQSDYDYIVVVDSDSDEVLSVEIPEARIEATVYSIKKFKERVLEHEVSVLECLFLPPELIIKNNLRINFEPSLPKLRAAISAKVSNSWVKTKKKFIVDKDYAPYIGLKSIFHCFRILEFGKQIATHGVIKNYGAANFIWQELVAKRPEEWTWPELEDRYKVRYNQSCSEFRLLAPKDK